MLTRKQHELLMFIHHRLTASGVSPSFDEMKDALGLKSKSGIHRLVSGLEERGFIRRLAHRARALEVLRLPDDGGAPRPAVARFSPSVIEGRFQGGLAGRETTSDAPTVQLPCYGRIAAGTPIDALRDENNMVDIPQDMLGVGEHYALEVSGDSMVEAGILDGDTIVIKRCDSAENGTIVVALIDRSEVTLKRLRRRGNTVALEPANPNYETRIFGADMVDVQGRLIGLMRRY